ncbi:MAG: hypothetical protein FWG03_09960 [Clostridiales bacterium]|nr:hypothetical protein [Clostridiales bacterium]
MTPKERFLAALHKRQPDRVPMYDYLFSQDLFEKVTGTRPKAYDIRLAIDLAAALGHDAVWAPAASMEAVVLDETAGIYRDEWGTVYKKNEDVSWPSDAPLDYPIKCREDFENLALPDASVQGRYTELKEAAAYAKERGELAVVGSVGGPVTYSWLLMGPEYLFMAMYDDPGLVKDVFDACQDFVLESIRNIAACGVDCMIIAEDLGYERGVFYSPDLMRENLFPYLKRMVDEAHSFGLPVILHCDGNVNVIMDDFVEIGFDAIHPLERKCGMDLKGIKQKYGDRLCLFGNVDSCETLALGTPEEVEAATISCLRDGAPGGGYVLGSDHSLNKGVKIENVMKMYETHKKYGAYPLRLPE